ncbi:MAG: hypothetical protein QOJ39_3143 [Candidatus Eremiobacteraeota bacterium]|nr:hypothetical protein [Candidatus Eremiobacteraeota bacterium]
MSARVAALAVAAVAMALVLAQDLYPFTPLYHTWQYALALAIALVVMLAYANAARRGEDGVAGKRLLVAMAGAAIVDVAGLASGLLGPDTASLVGTPGTVVPIPAIGAAAFFAQVDDAALARGSSAVVLRRRNAPEIAVAPAARRVLGESLVYLEPRPAAYIDAFDERGTHLTITQPTNASFLSPVLLFRERQRIGALDVPFDTFATPARHRIVRALYFTPQELAQFSHANAAALAGKTSPALVLTAADDAGKPLGITLAASGQTVPIAGIRVRATIGTYPALAVAAAPATWALVAGVVLFIAGIAWSMFKPRGGVLAGAFDAPEPEGSQRQGDREDFAPDGAPAPGTPVAGTPAPGMLAVQSCTPIVPDDTTGGFASVPTT